MYYAASAGRTKAVGTYKFAHEYRRPATRGDQSAKNNVSYILHGCQDGDWAWQLLPKVVHNDTSEVLVIVGKYNAFFDV
jgi:hypothetical protein